MRVTTLALALVAAALLLCSIGCGSGPAQQGTETGETGTETGEPGTETGETGTETGETGTETGETGTSDGRPVKQAGEYAKAYGFDVPVLALGTNTYQLRQGGGAARKDRFAHSSDYLPISHGPLATEKDAQIADLVLGLVNRCDLFRDEIEQAAQANLPTSKKFDRAIETLTSVDPDYTSYYLANHYDPSAPGWTGLCHNWAPAGVLDLIAPMVWSSDTIVGDQPTGIGDFREMVTAMLPRLHTDFIGRRNNTGMDEDEDTDVDLADVVASLEYAIQDHDYGIVFDVTSTAEVWNQPVDRYTQAVTDGSSDAAVAGLMPSGGTAKHVRLTIPYVVEAGYAHRGDTYRRSMELEGYLIEDAAGKVVDSIWVTPTRDHPDFMWIPTGLFSSAHFNMLRGLFHQGTRMEHVSAAADLCDTITAFAQTIKQGGTPSQADQDAVKGSLAQASKVIDTQKLDSFITVTASNVNIDPNKLAAAVTGP